MFRFILQFNLSLNMTIVFLQHKLLYVSLVFYTELKAFSRSLILPFTRLKFATVSNMAHICGEGLQALFCHAECNQKRSIRLIENSVLSSSLDPLQYRIPKVFIISLFTRFILASPVCMYVCIYLCINVTFVLLNSANISL